jgi:hypothetical protein
MLVFKQLFTFIKRIVPSNMMGKFQLELCHHANKCLYVNEPEDRKKIIIALYAEAILINTFMDVIYSLAT